MPSHVGGPHTICWRLILPAKGETTSAGRLPSSGALVFLCLQTQTAMLALPGSSSLAVFGHELHHQLSSLPGLQMQTELHHKLSHISSLPPADLGTCLSSTWCEPISHNKSHYTRTHTHTHKHTTGSVSLGNPNTFGLCFLCVFSPRQEGKDYLGVSKRNENCEIMGLINHIIKFFIIFIFKSLSLDIKGPSQDYTEKKKAKPRL